MGAFFLDRLKWTQESLLLDPFIIYYGKTVENRIGSNFAKNDSSDVITG